MPEVEEAGEKKKFMGVYSKNREEWLISDLASMCQSGTTIAFYDTLGPSAVEFILNQTNLTTVSCQGSCLRTMIMLKTQGRAKALENIISFDAFDSDVRNDAKSVGLNLYSFQEVIDAGAKSQHTHESLVEPKAETVYMFCYTSGTTGDPKAAELTHKNMLSAATAS